MPCFGCRQCGKCSRSTAHLLRCVQCGRLLDERVAACPSCGAPQPPAPGVGLHAAGPAGAGAGPVAGDAGESDLGGAPAPGGRPAPDGAKTPGDGPVAGASSSAPGGGPVAGVLREEEGKADG